jgi:mono/diheme cytochrome c family protein
MRIKRRTKRFFKWVALAIPMLLVAAFLYLLLRSPSRAAPSSITVNASQANLERGEYLFTTVCACDGCHSQRDFTRLGGPVVIAGRGRGNVMEVTDLPGQMVASNITPDRETGIGSWTDGEKIRAIREGIGKDGRALFPLMPYTYYRSMGDSDVQALVAYMNSLPAVRNPLPQTKINFPVSLFIKGVPEPVGTVADADTDGGAMYGEYLVTLAACEECHTPASRGQIDPGMRFAGGRRFQTPYGTVVSANITPDKDTGLGKWDFARFKERMQLYRTYQTTEAPIVGPERFTLMPWHAYTRLTEPDLEVIFLYLKSRRAISNKVETHPAN